MLVSKNDGLKTGGEAERPRQRSLTKRFQVGQVIPIHGNTRVIPWLTLYFTNLVSHCCYLSAAARRWGVSLVLGRGDP